jgi:hypothetical protein
MSTHEEVIVQVRIAVSRKDRCDMKLPEIKSARLLCGKSGIKQVCAVRYGRARDIGLLRSRRGGVGYGKLEEKIRCRQYSDDVNATTLSLSLLSNMNKRS